MSRKKTPEQPSEDQNEFLFAELNEEMRQDQVIQFVKKYLPFIIGGIVVFAIAAAAYLAWDSYRESQNKATSGLIADAKAALQTNPDEAIPALEGQAEGSDFYAYDAGMILGKYYLSQGDDAKAADWFAKIAASTSMDQPYKDLATIYGLMAATSTRLTAEQSQQVTDFIASAGPYQQLAEEVQIVDMVKAGKAEEAKAKIEAVLEREDVGASLRQRLTQLQDAL